MVPRRSSVSTIVAVAIVAYALCDVVHEAAGHGIAALLVPGVRVLSISSVALQTTGSSRFVAAAGSLANVLFGIAALALFRRRAHFSATAYFLWLFGSLNLFNGSGYPLYSAVLGSGDFEVVVRGLEPVWLWRVALGVVGAAAYTAVIFIAAKELARAVKREIPRLVFRAYVAGGALLVIAAAFNPISPSLILLSGVSSGFAAMAGLTLIPKIAETRTSGLPVADSAAIVPQSRLWIAAGMVIGTLFIAVLGPGISL